MREEAALAVENDMVTGRRLVAEFAVRALDDLDVLIKEREHKPWRCQILIIWNP
jgi:hypothetical protein